MRKLGFSQKTLSLMTESQINMILEKIKKKETKEAEQEVNYTTTLDDKDQLPPMSVEKLKDLSGKLTANKNQVTKKTSGPYDTSGKKLSDFTNLPEAKQDITAVTTLNDDDPIPSMDVSKAKTFSAQLTANKNQVTKKTSGPYDTSGKKLSDFTEIKDEVTEGKKKKKKYNPWAVCTSSVGRKNKKKFEDCVMGVKKKLKENRNPYEYLIESKMEEIVENNLSPKMTKGEIMSIIAEKKMMMKKPIGTMIGGEMGEGDTKTAPVKTPSRTTEKEPGKRKPNPGKNPGVSPAPKASYMEGDTKTAPTKTPTKTEPARRTANPGRKTGPQENPKPKAGKSDSDMESKKSEIITAIFNLIDKN